MEENPNYKISEKVLEASKKRLQGIIDTIPGAPFQYWLNEDDSLSFQFIGRGVEELFEVTQAEVQKDFNRIWKLIVPEDQLLFWESILSPANTLEPWSQEFRIRTTTGKLKMLSGSSTPDPYREGKTLVWNGLLFDITDRKRQETLLQTIYLAESNFSPDTNPQETFARLLDALLELTDSEYGFIGEVKQTSEGKPYLRTHAITNIAWTAELREMFEKMAPNLEFFNLNTLFGRVMTEGKPVVANDPQSDPRRGGLPQGHPPLNAFLGLPFYSGHKLLGMVGIANRPGGYDETLVQFLEPFLASCGTLIETYQSHQKRKQAEEQLKAISNRLMLATDVAKIGIWDWNLTNNDLTWNKQMYDLYGFSEKETLNGYETWRKSLHPSDQIRAEEEVALALQGKKDLDAEFRILWPNGGIRFIKAMATIERAADGSPLRMIGVNLDFTNQRENEEKLNKALERSESVLRELERSNQELDAFAYIASHDLKEPLRGIHNYSQFLLEDYGAQLDDEGREKLETLKQLAKRMDGLIKTLLRFSSVGRADLALSQINAGDLVRDARDVLRTAIEEAGTQIEIATDLPDVTCDPVLAGQVVQNLLANAIKYTSREHGRVEAGWNSDMRRPVFHVRDDGIGIREQDYESIFRIFKRLHGQNKYGGGLGAGLTIVKKIVERHGGRIWVESQSGKGSTFYFTLSKDK